MGLDDINTTYQGKSHQNNSYSHQLADAIIGKRNFQEEIQQLQQQVDHYTAIEFKAEEKRKEIFQHYKNKKISGEEYTQQVKALLPWDPFANPKYNLEKQIRELKVQQEIADISQPIILHNISQLGANISDGGTNNKGVFLLGEDKIARCSAHGYDDASRLLLYKDIITSPAIKKTLQVIKLDGDIYQVQERAFGKPVVSLSPQELETINSEHKKTFRDAVSKNGEIYDCH